MEEQKTCICREASEDEWQDAMGLAWRVFLRFNAADYPQEGMENFYHFITDSTLHRMFLAGSYHLFCAFENEALVGMITIREAEHISLLFVDGAHHKQGIGMKLVDMACKYCLAGSGCGSARLTVHAAPYAVEFYHHLGFCDLMPEQEADGIRFTPMEIRL